MKIFLANPHGFCAGVNRAINIVENALKMYSAPIYVRHEIVHNSYVVDSFRKSGVTFIEEISEVPDKAILVFSAHGVSQEIYNEAKRRKLTILDATCPLVTKVHMEISRASRRGEESILIGHAGHPEIEGTLGHYINLEGGIYLIESLKDVWTLKVKNSAHLSFMTQTTFSIDDVSDIINALRQRFPNITGPHKNDICYATANRQEAVRKLAKQVDLVLVIGSCNSSNSNRLVELVKKMGKQAFLIDNSNDIQEKWIKKMKHVGITAGASSPSILVKNVISRLKEFGGEEVISLKGQIESVTFELPKELCINLSNDTHH